MKTKPKNYWTLRNRAAQEDTFEAWEVYRLFCNEHGIRPSVRVNRLSR